VTQQQGAKSDTVTIALIPGDGVGAEVVPEARRVLEHVHNSLPFVLRFVQLDAGWGTFQATGTALPDTTLAALRQCQGALFGGMLILLQIALYVSTNLCQRKHHSSCEFSFTQSRRIQQSNHWHAQSARFICQHSSLQIGACSSDVIFVSDSIHFALNSGGISREVGKEWTF
jgi:hypothetical protein